MNDSLIVAQKISNETAVGDFSCLKSLLRWHPRCGEAYTIFTGEFFYRARLLELNSDNCVFKCFELVCNPELSKDVVLFQAVPAKERMELIIEKAVELGAAKIVPVVTDRSTTVGAIDKKQKKSHNWQKVAVKAAKQCRRAIIPLVEKEISLTQALETELLESIGLFLNEKEQKRSLITEVFKNNERDISLFVGPEGGFSKKERAFFAEKNIVSVTLGSRILRTETAAIASLSIISQV